MKIVSSEFVTSTTSYAHTPSRGEPVFAFLGRSNVGKSSLINMLLQRKKLAKTSSMPGKTATINYFLINKSWYIVDLPGYGWARKPKAQTAQWAHMTADFLTGSPDLTHLFLLIDSRHALMKIDQEFMAWLVAHEIPFTPILTKADKINKALGQARRAACLRHCTTHLGISPIVLLSSATHHEGREEVLAHMAKLQQVHARASK